MITLWAFKDNSMGRNYWETKQQQQARTKDAMDSRFKDFFKLWERQTGLLQNECSNSNLVLWIIRIMNYYYHNNLVLWI